MMENNISEDFVVATGISKSLKDFLSISFEYLNLNWKKHVSIDENLYRPTDISKNIGNPNKIKKELGWKAKYSFHEMIKEIIEYTNDFETRKRIVNTLDIKGRTALYISCKKNKIRRSQLEIAKAVGTSEVTLRNRAKEIILIIDSE